MEVQADLLLLGRFSPSGELLACVATLEHPVSPPAGCAVVTMWHIASGAVHRAHTVGPIEDWQRSLWAVWAPASHAFLLPGNLFIQSSAARAGNACCTGQGPDSCAAWGCVLGLLPGSISPRQPSPCWGDRIVLSGLHPAWRGPLAMLDLVSDSLVVAPGQRRLEGAHLVLLAGSPAGAHFAALIALHTASGAGIRGYQLLVASYSLQTWLVQELPGIRCEGAGVHLQWSQDGSRLAIATDASCPPRMAYTVWDLGAT